MSYSWDQAVQFSLTLPGTVMESFYGSPVPKANGRALIAPGHEAGSFVLITATLDEVDMLKETESDVFWQTPHYEGWKSVLVREDAADPERIQVLIERIYAANLAMKSLKKRAK